MSSDNLPKYQVGQLIVCDDRDAGDQKHFVVGTISDVDCHYDDRIEMNVWSYEIEWTDAEANPDVDTWYNEKDTGNFVRLYRDCKNGKIKGW